MFTKLGRASRTSLFYVFVNILKLLVFHKIFKIRKNFWDRLYNNDIIVVCCSPVLILILLVSLRRTDTNQPTGGYCLRLASYQRKKGSQQSIKAPMMMPRVRAALCSVRQLVDDCFTAVPATSQHLTHLTNSVYYTKYVWLTWRTLVEVVALGGAWKDVEWTSDAEGDSKSGGRVGGPG